MVEALDAIDFSWKFLIIIWALNPLKSYNREICLTSNNLHNFVKLRRLDTEKKKRRLDTELGLLVSHTPTLLLFVV